MADTTNQLRLTVNGQTYTVTLDVQRWMGDMLEELEDHLGGEPVLAWARRLATAFERGVRLSELRSRDILALVFMARSETEPDVTWRDVARSTAPYAVQIDAGPEVAPPAPPGPKIAMPAHVDAPVPSEVLSPTLAAIAAHGAAAQEPAPSST